MKTFALAAALCIAALTSSARATQEPGRDALRAKMVASYDVTRPETLEGYERASLEGFNRVFVLTDRVNAEQPGTLIFDAQDRLIAVGFERPTTDGVTVMDMEAMDFFHINNVSLALN